MTLIRGMNMDFFMLRKKKNFTALQDAGLSK